MGRWIKPIRNRASGTLRERNSQLKKMEEKGRELYARYNRYNQVLSGLVKMITHPDDWLLD